MTKLHETFEINLKYMNALVDLVNKCRECNISIRKFGTINNGFQLWFDGFEGDAVIHDFSYGHESGEWETYKMPWDGGDVSIHTTEELADLLSGNKPNRDSFIETYRKMTEVLKASVCHDIEMEEERYGE